MVSSLSDPEFDGREGREEKGDGRGGEGNCPESQGERNKHCATGVYPDGVCKCQSDGERQSFWNGDDEHRHADDEELDELLQVVHVPRVLANDERRDGEVEHENHDRQQRYRRAYTCTTATFKQPACERTIRYDTRSYYNVSPLLPTKKVRAWCGQPSDRGRLKNRNRKLESDVCCRLQVAPSGESYGGNRRPGRK